MHVSILLRKMVRLGSYTFLVTAAMFTGYLGLSKSDEPATGNYSLEYSPKVLNVHADDSEGSGSWSPDRDSGDSC